VSSAKAEAFADRSRGFFPPEDFLKKVAARATSVAVRLEKK
jgi:hypothetical protein